METLADADVATVAAAIGGRSRAAILERLMDGDSWPAGELATAAGVAPSTASDHLDALIDVGLIQVERRGRQRRFRLASSEVAHAIEALAVIAPRRHASWLREVTSAERLRSGRTCYDHLAGQLGVAVTEALLTRGALHLDEDRFSIPRSGEGVFHELGVDLDEAHRRRRAFAIPCLDWTEQRTHLAGALGAAVCERYFAMGWVERRGPGRAAAATQDGRVNLEKLGVDASVFESDAVRSMR
jgi:DNA-binding transcriptional ArsR family regulator